MSQAVAAQNKTKAIAKKTVGRQVRLWVRAKFLGFKRYIVYYSDPKFNRTSINPSLNQKESMTDKLLLTISEKESFIFTKPLPEKKTKDSEYFIN